MSRVIFGWRTLAHDFALCHPGAGGHREPAADAVWALRRLLHDPVQLSVLRADLARHGLASEPGSDEALVQALVRDVARGALVVTAEPLPTLVPCGSSLPPEKEPVAPPDEAPARTWIEVRVVDDRSPPRSLASLRYRLRAPDGVTHEGTLDERGILRVEGIEPGTCVLEFVDLRADLRAVRSRT